LDVSSFEDVVRPVAEELLIQRPPAFPWSMHGRPPIRVEAQSHFLSAGRMIMYMSFLKEQE